MDIKAFGAVVPAEIYSSWELVRQGDLSLSIIKPFISLITYLFLHGDGAHIVYNMVFFWIFGSFINDFLGKWWLLVLFIFTGACAGIFFTAMYPHSPIPLIGASGAVTGLEGAFFVFALTIHLKETHVWPISVPVTSTRLVIFALLGLGYDLFSIVTNAQSNVAFEAHVGGFTSGVVAALLIRYIFMASRISPKTKNTSTTPTAFHTCHECGIDDNSHTEMVFRYCSKCGNGFCAEHLNDHQCTNVQ